MSELKRLLGIIYHNSYLFSIMKPLEAMIVIISKLRLSFGLSKEKEWEWCAIKHKQVAKFLKRNYKITPSISDNLELDNKLIGKIWVFWWQGENNMPELIKKTYKSIVDNSNGHEVILLSQVNYSSFVDVPQTILDKVVNKKMSFAHLSDFIRLQLLSRYGGLWIDSTVLVLKPIDEAIFSYPFYSIHTEPHDNKCVGKYRYFVSLMASMPGNPFMLNCYNIFKDFWMRHERALDYLFMDYCIDYVASDPEYSEVLANIPFNNKNTLSLLNNYSSPFSEKLWKELIADTTFFKLNWKVEVSKRTMDGKETIYGHILNMRL